MTWRRATAVLVLATALTLAGCTNADGGGARPSAATGTSTTTGARGGAATTTAGTGAAGGTTTGIAVTLVANRLIVGGNALVFGAPAFQVRSYLERALLDPVGEDTQECGPGRLTAIEWREVTAYLDEADSLVGWYTKAPTFATETGIRIGATRSEVERAYPSAKITETTLGTELWVPLEGQGDVAGLSGVFDGGEPTSTLTALWSGATCVAR